ncbi:MAG TPA: radical SAM protein [Trichormus sp.]|jgi:DNA repair photolyase
MVEVKEIVASSIVTPQKVGSLSSHYDYSLNPYAGCAFSCSYCYVPKFPNARHDDFRLWGKWVEVKINAPELIRRDRTKIFGSRIFFSSATDPYQYIELKYRLSRQCLIELLRYKPAHLTMHTRSHLILQDVDLLKQFGPSLTVGVSLTTDDETVRREFEPMAPSVDRRIQLIKQLHEDGIDVYLSMSPLLPCNPERFAELVAPYVNRAWIDNMRWSEVNTRPELIAKYASHFEPENHEKLADRLRNCLADARERLNQPKAASRSRTYSRKNRREVVSSTVPKSRKPTESTATQQLLLPLSLDQTN